MSEVQLINCFFILWNLSFIDVLFLLFVLCRNFTFMWSHVLTLALLPMLLEFCPEDGCLPQCLEKYTLRFPLAVSFSIPGLN